MANLRFGVGEAERNRCTHVSQMETEEIKNLNKNTNRL